MLTVTLKDWTTFAFCTIHPCCYNAWALSLEMVVSDLALCSTTRPDTCEFGGGIREEPDDMPER